MFEHLQGSEYCIETLSRCGGIFIGHGKIYRHSCKFASERICNNLLAFDKLGSLELWWFTLSWNTRGTLIQ